MIIKLRDPFEWKRVFAFVPHVLDSSGDLVWLQFVERRLRRSSMMPLAWPFYEYRVVPSPGLEPGRREGTET